MTVTSLRRLARRCLGAVAALGVPRVPRRDRVVGSSAPASAAAASGPSGSDKSSTGLLSTNFWLASAQGDVWTFGHAAVLRIRRGIALAHPIVAITPTNDDRGYWLVASDGGVFTYGDAAFYGSTGGWP